MLASKINIFFQVRCHQWQPSTQLLKKAKSTTFVASSSRRKPATGPAEEKETGTADSATWKRREETMASISQAITGSSSERISAVEDSQVASSASTKQRESEGVSKKRFAPLFKNILQLY